MRTPRRNASPDAIVAQRAQSIPAPLTDAARGVREEPTAEWEASEVASGVQGEVVSGVGSASSRRAWLPEALVSWLRWTAAAVIGAAVAVSGFAPLNHASSVLNIADRPWLVVLMPSVLLALIGVVAVAVAPRRPSPMPRLVTIAALVLVVAGALSIPGSDNRTDSLLVLITAVVGPMTLLVALRHCDLPMRTVCIAFLAVTTAFLLRDDWVFIRDYGFPTGSSLFQAKFSDSAYDFHYYGLQNPDMTATFLLIPLTLSSLWAATDDLGRVGRILLACVAAVSAFTLVLTYVRFDIAVGLIIILWACVTARLPRGVRIGGVGLVVALVAAGILSGRTRSYLLAITNTNPSASGAVRFAAIGDGFRSMVHHPLTGVGLDRYGANQVVPAHSALAQAGADIGILGLLSLGVLTLWLLREGWLALRRRRHVAGLPAAAAVSAGVYALVTALTGGSREGLYGGFVDIPALAIVLMIAAWEQRRYSANLEPAITGRRVWGRLPLQSGTAAVIGCLIVTGAAVATTHRTEAPPSARPLDAGVTWQKVAGWSFDRALPSSWSALGGAQVTARGHRMVKVVMGSGPQTSQIIGPALTLVPGRYRIVVTGRVSHGRVGIGLLDVHSAQNFVASDLTVSNTLGVATVTVHVPRLTTARLVLFRSRPETGRSILFLRTVHLTLLGSGSEVWSFDRRLPTGWQTTNATSVTALPSAIRVDAGTQLDAYQLVGPAVALSPGRYRMTFSGRVLRGRFSLGLLDVGRDKFIASLPVVATSSATTARTVSLARRIVVKLILSNWAIPGTRSSGLLHAVRIGPAKPGV